MYAWLLGKSGTAGSPAIVRGTEVFCYDELFATSETLAQALAPKTTGAGPVAILSSDCVSMAVAILAAWRMNLVPAPINPGLPAASVSGILELLEPEWTVCEMSSPDRGADVAGGIAVAGYALERGAAGSEPDPALRDACSIHFTSGAIRPPRGVIVSAPAFHYGVQWEVETARLNDGSRIAQAFAPWSGEFLWSMCAAFGCAGTLCVPEHNAREGDFLRELLDRNRATHAHARPSMLRRLLGAQLKPGVFAELRTLMLSGETLLSADLARWFAVYGNRVQLFNVYRAMEVAGAPLCWRVDAAVTSRKQAAPVGKAIEGAAAAVLDGRMRPCPKGVAGSLYIRTAFPSPGYFRAPDLTAGAFVRNPVTNDPADLLYRTGDRARLIEDGSVELIERSDSMVGIEGEWVDTAAMALVIRQCAQVRDVEIVAVKNAAGDTVLCAYVAAGPLGDPEEWKTVLAATLPSNLLPASYVRLERLPRTLSGKIDRRQLPAPEEAAADSAAYVAPRSVREELLAGLWAGVLQRPRVGVRQDFFQLGGHSLLATQLLSRIRGVLGVEIPLRWLFEERTIEKLGQRMEREGGAAPVAAPAVQALPPQAEEPLSFAQMRLWFLDQLEPGQAVYNISSGVRLEGPLEIPRLGWSLRQMVRRHRVLRSSFHNRQGQAVVRVGQSAAVALGVVDLTGLPSGRREAVARTVQTGEAGQGFDLRAGGLLRCRLLRLGGEEHWGVFTMHHIVSDGWSMGILIRELSTLYAAGREGAAAALPAAALQYGDFVAWQRGWLRGPALEAQLEYWKRQLAGAPLLLELPTDYSRPAQPGYAGKAAWWSVEAALYGGLAALAQSEGVTLFMVLLAVWEVQLWRYSGQREWLIGTPIANRTRQELEGMLGLFANTLVLRAHLQGGWSFRQLLQRVRETALGAYAHQDLPFERLVEEVQPERRLNRQPLFQVAFTMQNVPGARLELPGLRLTAMEDEPQTSKFDLNLTVIAAGDRGIRGLLEYSTELFAPTTIERMLGHWRQLLEAVAADPGQKLWELPLLSAAERERMLVEWNATGEGP